MLPESINEVFLKQQGRLSFFFPNGPQIALGRDGRNMQWLLLSHEPQTRASRLSMSRE